MFTQLGKSRICDLGKGEYARVIHESPVRWGLPLTRRAIVHLLRIIALNISLTVLL